MSTEQQWYSVLEGMHTVWLASLSQSHIHQVIPPVTLDITDWRFLFGDCMNYENEVTLSSEEILKLKHLLNLDNERSGIAMSKGEPDDMAKDRRKVKIATNDDGTPVYKDIQGANQNEVNVKIVQAFIESGRIWDFMPKPDQFVQRNEVVLRDYAEKWLTRKRKLKPNSLAKYRKLLTEYIYPCVGKMLVSEITVDDVQAMLDTFSHLSEKTLKDSKSLLSQIMKYAVGDGLITKNPCLSLDLEIPSDRKTEREALPIDQYKDILSNLNKLNKNDQMYLGLVMYTGMRRGEALGMRWEDIDTENNVLHIRRNVTHPQQNAPVITTPKTKAGKRDIPIDGNLMKLLQPMQEHGFIIGDSEKPMTLSGHRNMWERINKQINLYGASAHVLRHSYLTYAVGETTDFKTVQGISGHADIGTLLNRYAHPQQSKIMALSQSMHNILTV